MIRKIVVLKKEEEENAIQLFISSGLATSERIGWKVDDIIAGEKKLDFTKPFMPESLSALPAIPK